MRLRRIGAPARGWALWLGAALAAGAGCETPSPPVPLPEPPEVPAEPPEPVEEPYPVVSQCEGGTIRVGAPRRIDEPADPNLCNEQYEVDFVVEARPADAMLLDMFQSHTLWNWRVSEAGETVRHEFSLRLAPHWFDSPYPGNRPGIRAHEPIVLQRCPEGDGAGPVLACTNVACGFYDDVSEVPSLTPKHLALALTVPERLRGTSFIREAETVEIPVTIRTFQRLQEEVSVRFELDVWEGLSPFVDISFAPGEIVLPAGWSRTETRWLRVTLNRYDYQGHVAVEPGAANYTWFFVKVIRRRGVNCVNWGLERSFLFRIPGPARMPFAESAR